MKYVKHYFTLQNFKFFNSDTEEGKRNFEEKCLPYIKRTLIDKAMDEKEFAEDNRNFIFEFKREYWSDERIKKMLIEDPFLLQSSSDPYLSINKKIEEIKSWKPFDLVLILKTEEEFYEECTINNMLKQSRPDINIKDLAIEEKIRLLNNIQRNSLRVFRG